MRLVCILCLCSACHARQMTTAEFAKKYPDRIVSVDDDTTTIKATGVGGTANGADAKLDQTHSTPPSIQMPWGAAVGGSADSSLSAAARVYGSTAFRWIAGIVGVFFLVMAYFTGKRTDAVGAVVLGATGIGLLVGTIFFPEWMELGLLSFAALHGLLYAHRHGALTGVVAWSTLAVHNLDGKFPGLSNAFNKAIKDTAEPTERAMLNKIAVANGAKSIDA